MKNSLFIIILLFGSFVFAEQYTIVGREVVVSSKEVLSKNQALNNLILQLIIKDAEQLGLQDGTTVSHNFDCMVNEKQFKISYHELSCHNNGSLLILKSLEVKQYVRERTTEEFNQAIAVLIQNPSGIKDVSTMKQIWQDWRQIE